MSPNSTYSPTHVPTASPTSAPTSLPSSLPTPSVTSAPTQSPTYAPTIVPNSTYSPTHVPTASPTSSPTSLPTYSPTSSVTSAPTTPFTSAPTMSPNSTYSPTHVPTASPTSTPTSLPTESPTSSPTSAPTESPTHAPTMSPNFTYAPTMTPTRSPTSAPTSSPTHAPTSTPTYAPTIVPNSTYSPTHAPTYLPTNSTHVPTHTPTHAPTHSPSHAPTKTPTYSPTHSPSQAPTKTPTYSPTHSPSQAPTIAPTHAPTHSPTHAPTHSPTHAPTHSPTHAPTHAPTHSPTHAPTKTPTNVPTHVPTHAPTIAPTHVPSHAPTHSPTHFLTHAPTKTPTHAPTHSPTQAPTLTPTPIPIRTFTTPTLPSALFENSTSSAIVLKVSSLPFRSISVKVLFYSLSTSADGCQNQTIPDSTDSLELVRDEVYTSPSSLNFSSSSSTSQDFVVIAVSAGCYVVEYSVSGPSSDEFVDPDLELLAVYSDSSIPDTYPVLESAIFSDSGTLLYVVFDSDTDRAGLSGTWTCSELFTFPGIADETCLWNSDSTVSISLLSTSTIVPHDNVTLISGVIKLVCTSSDSNCDSWPYASSSNAKVSQPSTSLYPKPVLQGSNKIGSCDSISIDAADSTGSGGRAMYYTWELTSTSGDTSLIENVLTTLNAMNSGYGTSSLTVANEYLDPGSSYQFTLTLENFLGWSTTSSKFKVSISNTPLPTIIMDGSNSRTIYKYQSLSIYSWVFSSVCGKVNYQLDMSWTVAGHSNLVSTSKNPRIFSLAAYTLDSGTIYNVTLSVVDGFQRTNNDTVNIKVKSGDVLARISQGNAITVGPTADFSLDASQSIDFNVDPSVSGYGESAGLSFEWTCIQTKPSSKYGKSCGISSNKLSNETLSISGGTLSSGGQFLFTVVATATDGRSDSDTITVIVQSTKPPEVYITPMTVAKVNPSSKLVIQGTISDFSTTCTTLWSLEDGYFSGSSSLSNVILSSSSRTISNSPSTIYLVIKANSLIPRESYTFRLTASTSTSSSEGYSELTVIANSAPTSGSISVSPASGYVLQTKFTLSASDWTDDETDLPLLYSYYYYFGSSSTLTDDETILASLILSSSLSTYLPLGSGVSRAITCAFSIADQFEASVTRSTIVTVNPIADSSLTNLNNLTNLALNQSILGKNILGLYQAVSASSSVLNAVKCSLNCSVLHRDECVESNTCGYCLDGYDGVYGYSNYSCIIPADSCSNGVKDDEETSTDCGGSKCAPCASGFNCTADFDCLYGNCVNQTCVTSIKSCSNNCSSQGTCYHTNRVGETIFSTSCLEGDLACFAVCNCSLGFYGSYCQFDNVTFSQVKSIRSLLISSINESSSFDDSSSEDDLSRRTKGLYNSIMDISSVADDSISTAVSTISSLATSSISVGIEKETTKSFLNTLSVFIDSTTATSSDSIVTTISDSIGDVTAGLFTSLTSGEDATEITTDNIRFLCQKLDADDLSEESFNAPIPYYEESITTSSTSVSLKSLDSFVDATSDVSFSVINFNKNPYQKLNSNPILSSVGRFSIQISSSSRRRSLLSLLNTKTELDSTQRRLTTSYPITLVIPNDEESISSNVTESHTISCNWDEYDSKTVNCSSNFQNTTVECNGISKTVTITCTALTHAMCNLWDSTTETWDSSSCTLVSYNPSNTTCECYLSSNSSRRRLADGTDSLESIDYTSVQTVTYSTSKTSIVDAFIAEIKKNATVFITIAVVFASFFIWMFFGWRMDKKNQKKAENLYVNREEKGPKIDKDNHLPFIRHEFIPSIFGLAKLQQMKFQQILLEFHAWIKPFRIHSISFPAVEQILILVCLTAVLMAANAIIVFAAFPVDHNSCESKTTYSECLDKKNSFDSSMNLCAWKESSKSCLFNEPNVTARNTVLIAFCSILISIPIFEFLFYVFKTYITPPAGQVQSDILQISTSKKIHEPLKLDQVLLPPNTSKDIKQSLTLDPRTSLGMEEKSGTSPQNSHLASIHSDATLNPKVSTTHEELDYSFMKLKSLVEETIEPITYLEENEGKDNEITTPSSTSRPNNISPEVWNIVSSSSLCQEELIRLVHYRQSMAESTIFFQSVANKQRQINTSKKYINEGNELEVSNKKYDDDDDEDEEYGNGATAVENVKPQNLSSLAQSVSISLTEFDNIWSFNENGHATVHTAQKIRKDIDRTIAFFFYAKQLSVDQQNTLLKEIHEVEGLNEIDKKLITQLWPIHEYLYSVPVSPREKMLAWATIITFLIGLLIGLIFFGLRNGAKTNNTWLLAFFITLFFEILVNIPAKLAFQSNILSLYFSYKVLRENRSHFSINIKAKNQTTKRVIAQTVSVDRPGDLSFKIALRCGHLDSSSTILENYIGRPSTAKLSTSEDVLQTPNRPFNAQALVSPNLLSSKMQWIVSYAVPVFIRLSCGYHEPIISIFATSFITMILFFFIGCYMVTPALIVLPFLVFFIASFVVWFWLFDGQGWCWNYFGRSALRRQAQERQTPQQPTTLDRLPSEAANISYNTIYPQRSPSIHQRRASTPDIIQRNDFILDHGAETTEIDGVHRKTITSFSSEPLKLKDEKNVSFSLVNHEFEGTISSTEREKLRKHSIVQQTQQESKKTDQEAIDFLNS